MARNATAQLLTPAIEGIRFATRRQLAALYRERYGADLSPRSLERWPLRWRYANRTAVACVHEFFVEAEQRFQARPAMRGGKRTTRHSAPLRNANSSGAAAQNKLLS
jgi:hypothetical protein